MPSPATFPPLTPAQQKLVQDNQRFAFRIAQENSRLGMDFDDLRQEALLGLVLAAQRYDVEQTAAKFTTYAAYWIRARIWSASNSNRNIVRIDTTQDRRRILPALRRMTRAGTELAQIDPAKVAEALGVQAADVADVLLRLQARAADVRLDAGLGFTLRAEADAEDRASARQLHRALADAVDRIARKRPRYALVLRERLLAEKPTTLRELGERMALSRERVRQLEVKALERVRQEMGA